MENLDIKKVRISNRLLDVVDQYRSMIIDPVEQELGDSPHWKPLRSRLLKAFGDRGLAGRIQAILDAEFAMPEKNNFQAAE
jgi:hypothetical protein